MKKSIIFFCLTVFITITSCRHHNDTSISFRDAERYYSMNAYFNRNQTRKLEYYLDRKLKRENNFSFVNTDVNDIVSLDNNASFYLRKTPGHIEIKIDKDANSFAAYQRVRSLCEGMKEVITH
ncbi:MAG: hypothetical protein ABIY51_09165 [Ferruginibacter sp.]